MDTHFPPIIPNPEVSKVQESCAFLGDGMARIDHLEEQVHGRQRRSDEMYFGVAVQVQARFIGKMCVGGVRREGNTWLPIFQRFERIVDCRG